MVLCFATRLFRSRALDLAVVAVAKNLAGLFVGHIGVVEQTVELLGDLNHVDVIGVGIQRVRNPLNAENAVDRRRAIAPRERQISLFMQDMQGDSFLSRNRPAPCSSISIVHKYAFAVELRR